jgi:hypothetical protein
MIGIERFDIFRQTKIKRKQTLIISKISVTPGPTKAQARKDNPGRAMHKTKLSNDTLGNYVGLAR